MSHLFHDLVHDLREKRLLPVAVLLLLALVAAPVLLISPAKQPAPAPVPAQAAIAQDATMPELKDLAVVTDAADRGGSTLDQFKSVNPFLPPKALTKAVAEKPPTSTAGGTSQASSGAAGGATGKVGVGGGQGAPQAIGTPAPRAPAPTVRTAYTYVVDLTYVRNGNVRTVRGMDRLGMLPNEESPLLIFLGVSADGDNAVFLVDSGLDAEGEGSCTPSNSECATLTMGAGDEHEFTDGAGNGYGLRIDEIRKVKLSRASAKSSRRSKRPRARTAVTRPFQPPVLADLLTVEGPGSSNARAGR